MFTLDQVRSLGGRTDLEILLAQGAEIEARSEYLRISSPENPGFYWGNLLFFRAAPRPGDIADWESKFHHEFRLSPGVRHVTFGWDEAARGEIAPFEAAGYLPNPATVLTLEAGGLQRPQRMNPALEVRPLTGDAGWEAMIQHQIACRLEGFNLESYEPFKRRQAAAYRRMAERGGGSWWGGFLQGRLVADCGLFFFGGLGRFQAVGTHPEFRRQGICGALIHAVCERAFGELPSAKLVMAASPGEPAERIYRSVGFAPEESQHGLCRYPRPLTTS